MRPLEMIANAPLCAISRRWPRVLHAAPSEQVGEAVRGHTVEAMCGKARLRLAVIAGEPLLWPPAPATPRRFKRCRGCFEATGRPYPRRARSLYGRRP